MPLKKPVDSDSDSDAPPAPKPKAVKKKVVDSDSDDEPIAKPKPAAKKKVAVDSDSDDEPVAVKPKKAAARKVQSDSDSDEPALPKGKPQAKPQLDSDDSDDDARPRHADPSAGLDTDSDSDSDDVSNLVDHINYDGMDTAAFIAHLKSQTKNQRIEEKRAVEEHKAKALTSSTGGETFFHFDGAEAYSYNYMLTRVMAQRQGGQVEAIKVPSPKLEKQGSKRTVLTNFAAICRALGRTLDEVKDYVLKTLTCQGSIADNGLLLRYQNAKVTQFERLFSNYIEEFVRCRACGRCTTTLSRNSANRLLLLSCSSCGASHYLQSTTGATYTATTTKRSRLRNNAMV